MKPPTRDLYRVASLADVDLAAVEWYVKTDMTMRPSTAKRIERAMRELGLGRLVRESGEETRAR